MGSANSSIQLIHTGILERIRSTEKYTFHFRKKWYNYHIDDQIIPYSNQHTNTNTSDDFTISSQRKTDTFPIQFILPIQLTLSGFMFARLSQLSIDTMKPCFIAVQFTNLNIDCNKLPVDMLIEIIRLLPNLDSLEVSSQ